MWVYRKCLNNPEGKEVHEVGFYDPSGFFHCASRHEDDTDAMWRVHFLNGGSAGSMPG